MDKIVALLEDKSLVLTDMDVKGVLVDPAIGERVIDPSCGSGGFLIRVYDIVSEKIRLSDFSEREKERRLGGVHTNVAHRR